MKLSKSAITTARRIFRLSHTGGKLDEAKLSLAIERIASGKPRGYLGILHALHRLVRLEQERHQAVVESAVELDAAERARIAADFTAKYQSDLQFEYRVNPALLGGLRVRVGNDVWDGSVSNRLERLAQAF